ncbi:MAG: response regulator [Dissulfurispiraceae bacterium]|nr:response regulator [Dissulfurispiraceae bacterium]
MKKILIVDDEDQFRFAVKLTLKRAGYEVFEAENGAEALNMIMDAEEHNNIYDLIILDIQMPVMSGIEFVYALQQNDITTPVLILSGYADNLNFALELGRNGCTELMVKQFEPEELLKKIDLMITSKKKTDKGDV